MMSCVLNFITLVTVATLVGCGVLSSHGAAPKTSTAKEFDAMRRVYAALDDYEDAGEATLASSGGGERKIKFTTIFTRGSGLSFTFRSTLASGSEVTGSLVVEGNRVRTDYLGTTTEWESVQAAAHELQGVSMLSSMFVPQLLFGVDPWSCCAQRVEVDGMEIADGRRLIRIHVSWTNDAMATIWMSEETSLIERIQVQDRRNAVGPTDIRYTVAGRKVR